MVANDGGGREMLVQKQILSDRLQYLPLLSTFSWLVTLIVLLIHWAACNTPRYASQNGIVPFISDIGAQQLKPVFVLGCIFAGAPFLATLIIIHRRRTMLDWTLPPSPTRTSSFIEASSNPSLPITIPISNTPKESSSSSSTLTSELAKPSSRGHTVSSWTALIFTSISLTSLVLLAGFDCLRYPRLHSLFLMTFGVPLFIGALGSVSLIGIQMAAYPEVKWLRKALWMKAVSGVLVFIMTLAFSVRMGTAERPFDEQFDQAAILEWLMGLTSAIYILTYWYDLRHILRAQPPAFDPVKEA